MSTYSLVPSDMAAASSAASDAADAARGADGSEAMSSLAAGMPGSTTAEIAPQLGDAWTSGVGDWAGRVSDLSEAIDQSARDGSSTDSSAGALFNLLTAPFEAFT